MNRFRFLFLLFLILQPGTPSPRAWAQSPRTVRVAVEQAFGEAKTFRLPLDRLASEALAGAGLKVPAPGAIAADTLTIRLHGVPHKAYDAQNIAHYIGATVDGEILAQGPSVVQLTFLGEHLPASMFVSPTMLIHPEDAPFMAALESSTFLGSLSRVIASTWGARPSTVLLSILNDPDEACQRAAVRALGEFKDPAVAPKLLEWLKRPGMVHKPGLQLALIEALGTIGEASPGDASAGNALVAVVSDPKVYEKAREAAAKLLGNLKYRPATLPLANALNIYLGWNFQHEIFQALVSIGDGRAIGPLATQLAARSKRTPSYDATLESIEQSYDRDLAGTLRKLSGQDFGTDGPRWLQWWQQHQKDFPSPP